MENGSLFSLLERSQPPGSSILCFNRKHRITFISRGAEKISLALVGRRPTKSEVLPSVLRDMVAKLGNGETSAAQEHGEPLVVFLKDGSLVKTRFIPDPKNSTHCLIFELENVISSPDQLKSLGLSSRETEVAFWIYQKKTNWEIGKILGVSPRTVEKHIENIFRKLGVNDRASLTSKMPHLSQGNNR